MKILDVNLYTVSVRGPHGLLGSFVAAAIDIDQAKAIGEQWVVNRGFGNARVEARRKHIGSDKPIYVIS